jgi:hypothetical protein
MASGSSAFRRMTALLLIAAACCAGCRACGDGFVAELIASEKSVERDFGSAVNAWSRAEKGARFEMGDGVRTGRFASARLGLSRGGRLLVKSDTVIRFTRDHSRGEAGGRIEVQQGGLTIETGQLDLGISTSRGVVRLAPESEVQVLVGTDKIRFDVMVGRAEFAGPGQSAPLVAETGRGFELEVLKPTIEPPPAAQPAMVPAISGTAQTSEEPPAVATESEADTRGARGGPLLRDLEFQDPPESAYFTLPAGETATIHDPAPPTDLRMTIARCSGLAVLEFDRGSGRFDALRARGTGEIRARVAAGNYRYRVRCARSGRLENPPVSAGRLVVARDAATRPLPSKPVSITADADGRRYTVSYQNRLPVITLRWPEPPATRAYTLRVTPERGAAFSVAAKSPSVTLAAGRLSEGLHRFQFEGGGRRSEQGLLRVAFDYKARTAYLTSPIEGQAPQGERARFAGGTLLGSVVAVHGAAMTLDSQGRFATDVAVPRGSRGLAVRVAHPSTGIHYYVRHLGGSGPAGGAPR